MWGVNPQGPHALENVRARSYQKRSNPQPGGEFSGFGEFLAREEHDGGGSRGPRGPARCPGHRPPPLRLLSGYSELPPLACSLCLCLSCFSVCLSLSLCISVALSLSMFQSLSLSVSRSFSRSLSLRGSLSL
jgi:hypothetical protein